MDKKITLFSLVLLIVAAIDSIRTLPTTALFGSSLVFFFILSALIFLIPVAFISAEFSSRFPDRGGVFHWIREAFGNRMGALAVWLQWINTMVWYPTMLFFIAGTAAYLIHPPLANQKLFLLTFSLLAFWVLTFLNLKGIRVSAKINSLCATIGTLIPMLFLILLGVFWIVAKNPLAISLSWKSLIPTDGFKANSSALVTIMASFLGMELAGVHIGDIENPQRNFPKAIGYSVLILLATLIFGSLSIGIVIPQNEIRFVDGIMQTFTIFFDAFHMPFLSPVLAFLIIIGSMWGSVNWLLSPAKGLLQIAEHGFLPDFLMTKNQYGIPFRILVLQGLVVSFFCFIVQFSPNINAFYWFLMALSTGLYMLMYILLFLAALKLGRPKNSYQIPFGIRKISCLAGLFGCLITIIVGFQPSPDIVIQSTFRYGMTIGIGFIAMLSPIFLLWIYQKKKSLPLSSKSV